MRKHPHKKEPTAPEILFGCFLLEGVTGTRFKAGQELRSSIWWALIQEGNNVRREPAKVSTTTDGRLQIRFQYQHAFYEGYAFHGGELFDAQQVKEADVGRPAAGAAQSL